VNRAHVDPESGDEINTLRVFVGYSRLRGQFRGEKKMQSAQRVNHQIATRTRAAANAVKKESTVTELRG
jgi:hypothetical protein